MIEKPLIEINNLTVIYNENTPFEVTALKEFSISVKKGDILIVTGGNGSGKSTLLNAIAGTIPVKTGKICINDVDITKWSAIKRAKFIGSVHQDTLLGTCPNLTIHENFQLTRTKRWWIPLPYSMRMNEGHLNSIQKTGLPLDTRGSTKINMLSGGQRQAIAVCLAFENLKPLLLFDEFTSALDEGTVKRVIDYTFINSQKHETTIIMVMHNVNFIKNYCTNIIRL